MMGRINASTNDSNPQSDAIIFPLCFKIPVKELSILFRLFYLPSTNYKDQDISSIKSQLSLLKLRLKMSLLLWTSSTIDDDEEVEKLFGVKIVTCCSADIRLDESD